MLRHGLFTLLALIVIVGQTVGSVDKFGELLVKNYKPQHPATDCAHELRVTILLDIFKILFPKKTCNAHCQLEDYIESISERISEGPMIICCCAPEQPEATKQS